LRSTFALTNKRLLNCRNQGITLRTLTDATGTRRNRFGGRNRPACLERLRRFGLATGAKVLIRKRGVQFSCDVGPLQIDVRTTRNQC
jgi:hypothetical protein